MAGSSDDNGSLSNGGSSSNNYNYNNSSNSNSNSNIAAMRGYSVPDNASVPKPKRLACMICRKRKLKCDGVRPSCSTCSRLGHSCAYDEQRRKSGPKRGYVKALEERLKQVETLLKTQDPVPATSNMAAEETSINMPLTGAHATASSTQNPGVANPSIGLGADQDMDAWRHFDGESPQQAAQAAATAAAAAAAGMDDFNFNSGMGIPMNDMSGGNFTWEMIGLGLEEPLPPQETIDELHQIYFEKVHPSMPMVHQYRYLAAMNLAPNQRPPVCLRYAMWTLACSITDKFADLKDLFYQRARRYVEGDYVKGYGEHMISVAHCQTHILLAAYEMRMMYFPRAWINTGSAVRLAQMIGLHRLDGAGLDVKQCLPPPKDWTEREERRRTFWMAFCEDRYASIGTGWPMTIDERDIMTRMPSSEEAFNLSRPEQSLTLSESTSSSGVARLSCFGGVVLLACLFGRNLVHLHRPDEDDQDYDLNGPFWKRHRQMDSTLLNTSLGLPPHLKLPSGLSSSNVIFTNMSIHTSTICLHQAAIFKADKNKLAASVSSESKVRCITAANEIASIMRTISHLDLSTMNPFISFCLYVAARVFVQYLKSRPDDVQAADSLRFLLSAMNALKRQNPLTESFLVQLDVDFEALAVRIPKLRNAFPRPNGSPTFGRKIDRAGLLCVDPEGAAQGMTTYREAGSYEDDVNGPEMVDGHVEVTADVASGPLRFGDGQPWVSADAATAPGLTPSSGNMYDSTGSVSTAAGHGFSEVHNMDGPSSSEGGRSTGPSPNSSRTTSDAKSHMTPSMSSTQTNAFYEQQQPQPPPGFASATSPSGGGGFPMPSSGWTDLSGQQAPPNMTPVGQGVLRALMNMGPMDAMDLSSWDAN